VPATALHTSIEKLRKNVCSVFLGNPEAVDRVICCLLARGHVLIEDVPGVGKTVLATALARSVDATFSRIQLTPDLLPSDILGVSVFTSGHAGGNGVSGIGAGGGFEFRRGPIFANIVLADEINRTPPRTQTALLEAMSEATVTVDGRMYTLEQPFILIATQNPFDFEGTYPLPENQLDRFLMRLSLGYPRAEDEARVLRTRPAEAPLHTLAPVLHAAEVREMQSAVDAVRLDGALVEYIVALANATRRREDLTVGLSPRGTLALAQASRATAVLGGRDYVIPEDITGNVIPVCAHRIIARAGQLSMLTGLRARLSGGPERWPADSPQGILQSVLAAVPAPV
jgi:MoxR-like ATPase